MTCTLDGKFIEFSAELTHKAYKGIDINPLILDVFTEIIVHDYLFADAQDPNNSFSLIDRDHDGFPDYLINLYTGLHLPIVIPDNVTVTKPVTPEDRTMDLYVPETDGYVCVILPDPMPDANYRAVIRRGENGEEDTYLSGNNFWRANGNIYFVDELGYIDEDGYSHAQSATYTLDFRSALAIEAVDCTPNEFDIIYSVETAGEKPYFSNPQLYWFEKPEGESLLGTYGLVTPLFFTGLSPTAGRETAVVATVTNDGVIAESGVIEFYVTDPDGAETLIETIEIEELRPWQHLYPLISWTPDQAGLYTITARIPGDSPDAMMSIEVEVNAEPYSDAGVDFVSTVGEPTTFDGTRTDDSDGYIRTYFWDFGDGEWGAGMTVTHVYDHSGTYKVRMVAKDDDGAMSEDVMQVTILETRCDLIVDTITVTPAEPEEGQEVTITATIKNIGVGPVDDEFFVGFYIDGAYEAVQKLSGQIDAGQSVDVSFTWDAVIGNHLFTFVADDMEDRIDEANEDNNASTIVLYPEQIYFADILVEGVELSIGPEDPTPWGTPITFDGQCEKRRHGRGGHLPRQLLRRQRIRGLRHSQLAVQRRGREPDTGQHLVGAQRRRAHGHRPGGLPHKPHR